MTLAFTLAIGDTRYGQYALNWALSVKAAHPQTKIALIFHPSAIAGIEEYIHRFFDYTYQVQDSVVANPVEYAFKLKTEFYDIVTQIAPEAEAYLFMDADTIMLSGRSVDEYFTELKDVDFTMWCNDVYDFNTSKRMRDDYTFWCDLERLPQYFEGGMVDAKMPQVNSSFIYFKKNPSIYNIFYLAKATWHNPQLPHKKYRGVMPDEFCFNLSLCQNKVLPHQIPYYPIFFSFASANFEEQYIRNWKAIGFAGDTEQHANLAHLYRHNVEYFRLEFDVPPFEPVKELPKKKQQKLISLKCNRRTLFRRTEVINSDGGIFNPDGIQYKKNHLATIHRKERNHDFYEVGHSQHTALPHVYVRSATGEENFELNFVAKDEKLRFEDFRIIEDGESGDSFYCSHTVVKNNLTPKMRATIGLSSVNLSNRTLTFCGEINLPIETSKVEKNWVFFTEGDVWYCIYSISPYMIFYSNDTANWNALDVPASKLNWCHKGKPICISTKPVLIGEEYLIFFHTKEGKDYWHGAALINAETKQITHYTKHRIDVPHLGEGWQKGLLYISGLVYLKEQDLIKVYAGEGDSHSVEIEYKASDFVGFVKEHTPKNKKRTNGK